MKTYGRVDIYAQVILTSVLAGGEWSASRSGRFTPVERAHFTHWIGGWVGPRVGHGINLALNRVEGYCEHGSET
jgi:hypothetical protein